MRLPIAALGGGAACALWIAAPGAQADAARAQRQQRIAAIHERFVFADIHAHPSRFHRANSNGEVGKVMGGNFFRVWQPVHDGAAKTLR